MKALGGNSSACGPASSNIGPCILTGTPYEVTIKTPSPSCSSCDPLRSVQVTVRHPNYGLTFARVLGIRTWDPGITSVSGLVFGKSYTVITLRPPKVAGSTFIVKDIQINGGSVVNVDNGDVGSNANMEYAGSGSMLTVDSGYSMYYFDPLSGPLWGSIRRRVPRSRRLSAIANYRYPLMTGSVGVAPTYDDARASQYATLAAVERADTDPSCAAEVTKVNTTAYAFMATQAANTIYCYNPGIYESGPGARNATITAGTGEVALLKPGAYYLKSGADIGGRLIGGYEPSSKGSRSCSTRRAPGTVPGASSRETTR